MKKIDTLKTLTRTMQSFVAIMLVTLMAVGNVVAQTTYSHTITAQTWSALGAQSLNGVSWTAAGTTEAAEPYFGYADAKGQQFGSGNKPFSALTLTTSEIAGTITSVKVNTSGASNINATFKVKVGDTYFTTGEADNVALTATATDYTFTGSASGAVVLEWAQTSSKAIYVKSIEITYTPAAVAVAAPVFAPVAGLYYAAQTVTITCETTGAIIHYTLDGTTPTAESAIYTAPITVDSNMTIKAIAVKDSDNSTVASATYTFPVEVANIAAFKAANTATNSTIYKITGDVTFVFENGANIYVQDTTGGLLIYDNPGINTVTGTYTEGDVISGGVFGTYTLYNGLVELLPTKDLAASTSNTGAVAPVLATIADIKANYAQFESKLVTLKDVTFAAGSFNTNSATNVNVEQDGQTMQVRNVYKTLEMNIPAGYKADVTGLVLRYNNNFQIAPRSNDDIEFTPVELPYAVDFDQNTDPGLAINNGENTNKWFMGQAEGFDNNKLFISSTNGVTNKYDVTAASNVTVSRDLIIPENGATLSFTSRVDGEANRDMLSVYLYNYTNNILNTNPTYREDIQGESDWTEHTINITPDHAGQAKLVFAWVNNNQNGEQYPAAIDNISVTAAACAQPIALDVTVSGDTAMIIWNTTDSTQNSWTLEYKLEDHSEWYSMNTTVPTVTLTALQGNSTYDVRVKANCGTESSEWTETQFNVVCMNYVVDIFDTTVTVGTGTNTSYLVPFNTLYGYSFTEQIFPAAEINVESVIKSISFYFKPSSSTTAQTNSIVLYMKNVERSAFSATDYEEVSESDVVFSGNWTIPANEGWTTIQLSKPFKYDGHSNLMIAMHEKTSGYSTRYFTTTEETAASISFYHDSYNPNPYSLTSYSGYKAVKDLRNNIQIAFYEDKSYCGDPLACATPDSITFTDITTDGATISWTGTADNYSFEYKTGDEDWTLVAVTGNTYTLTGLEQKTAYTVRIKALCGENNNSLYSEEVSFTTASVCPVVTNITTYNLSTTTSISWTAGSNENEWNLRFRPVGSTEWVNLHISGIASTTFGGLLDQTDYEVEIMALCDPNDEENQSLWEHYEFTSGCAPFEMPYEEGFNTAVRPDCWDSENITFDGTAAVADSAAQWLMTPPIQIPVEGNTYAVIDMQGNASFKASYRGTQMNRFTEIAVLGNDSTGHYIIEIPASYKDKAVNFLFLASDNFSIDNIEFTQCPFIPVNLTAANPLNNSVELTWNGINNNGWVLEYAVAGTDNWTSVNVEQTSDTVTYTLTGLDGSTDYEFRVSTLCVGGFASQPSNVATMTTRCDAISAPYEDFNSTTYTFDCWTRIYTGTDSHSYIAQDGTYAHRLQMYNYYNRALDSTDNTALGDLYAILPMIDTTLNVLQINFTAEKMRYYDPDVDFQLGVITDINRPEQTFMQLSNYTAVFDPAEYTYILNNVEYVGNLAFRVKKSTETKDLRLSNIKVEYIPACQKPINFVATPTSETTMSLTWGTVGRQNNWDIKYKKGQYSAAEPDDTYTSMTANLRPRIVNNLEYGAWYTFYIRNHCSATEQSEWVGPFKKQLLMEYNVANTPAVTSCHGTVVFEEDTTGTNIMTLHASSANSWVVLNGSVNMSNNDTLFVYDGDTVNASKLLAKISGNRSNLTLKPTCENDLTLYLKKSANSTPSLDLEISCEALPTCSAPSKPVFDEVTSMLTWEAGCWGNQSSFNIQAINVDNNTVVLNLTATTTSIEIPVAQLPNNHTFVFKVQPVCNDENGEWSEESEEFLKESCANPTDLTVNTANFTTNGQKAILTWARGNALQNTFEVGYRLQGSLNWVTNTVNATTYTTEALDENVNYEFRVKAICNAEEQSDYVTTTAKMPCVHGVQGIVYNQIGDGTGTNSYIPTYIYYSYSLTEQIYTAAEMGEAGLISSVSFYNTSSSSTRDIDIYMMHTDKTQFSGGSDWIPVTARERVYSGDVDFVSNDWTVITFDTPFDYDGRSNVVLVVDDNTGDWSSSISFKAFNASSQAIRVYNDYTDYNPSSPSSYSGSVLTQKNQVQFGVAGTVCGPIVSCPAPTDLAIAKVDVDYVTIHWTKGGNETEWTLVYSMDGGADTTIIVTDTFYTITGLEASSSYELVASVYANCDVTSQSQGVTETLNVNTPFCAGAYMATVNIGSGTNTYNLLPTYSYYNYSYTQQIYLANEIAAPTGGTISSVTFSVKSGNVTRNVDLYLMNTTETTVSSWLPITTATKVFSGSVSFATGQVKIDFTTPFMYDGESNILLIMDDNTGSYVSSPQFYVHTGHAQCSRYVYSDGTNYNPSTISSGGSTTTNRNNVKFEMLVCPPPACHVPVPTDLQIVSNTAILSWTGNANSYTLKYRVAGTEEFTTVSNIMDTFYTFTNLIEGSIYQFKLQGDCGVDDGVSKWTELWQFRVPYTCPAPLTMPYVEDFESTSTTRDCWTTVDADHDGYAWMNNTDYAAAAGYAPFTSHSGIDCKMSASFINGIGALNPDNWLISPAIHVDNNAQMSYWLKGQEPDYCAEHYSVYVATGNTIADFLATTPVASGVTTNDFVDTVVDLSAYAGQNIYVAFRHHDVTDMYWLLLDDFSVTTRPTCTPPTNLVYNVEGDTLTWTKGDIGNPASYNIRWRVVGETTWSTGTATDTIFSFGALLSNSNYEVQVQSNCGGTDGESDWSDAITFISPCLPMTITEENPYTEDFEGYTGSGAVKLANCWYSDESGYVDGSVHSPFVYVGYAASAQSGTNTLEMKGNTGLVALPEFTNATNTLSLTFWANRVSSSYVDTLQVGVLTQDGTFVPVETLTSVGARGSNTFVGPIEFTNVTAQGRLALRYRSTGSSQSWNFDDFTVYLTPSCFMPTDFAVTDVTDSSAKITWADDRHQGNYAIEYKAENDTAWTTVAGDTNFTVTLTNLNYLTTYTVRMKAVCGENDGSDYTDEIEFTTYCVGYSIVGGEGTIEIKGTTSSTSGYFPTYTLYNYSYTQQIYKASEMNVPEGCTIKSVTFEVSGSNTATRNIDVYLMNTTAENVSSWLPINDAVKVYSGSVLYGGETVTLNFSTPFEYDGTSNLALIADDNTGSWTSTVYFKTHTGHSNCSKYIYQDAADYNPAAPSGGTTSTTTSRNNVTFGVSTRVVSCPPDNDLAIKSIEPIGDNCDLSNAKVTVELQNNSYLNAVNGFTAILTLNDTAEVITETVNEVIAPNSTYTFTFAQVPAYTDGSNDIMVTVIAANDEDSTNNEITLKDIRQVVPATVPYEQDFSAVVLGRDAWTQGTENNNPNLWTINGGVLTFMDNDTLDAQNYVITHCIDIPAGQMQVSYDYNALSNMPENLNVYMGTTPDIASMTLIGSHSNFTKADEDYTFNYLFNNENEGIYYFAIEALSTMGNVGVTFDNLAIMPMVDVIVTAGPNGTVSPIGTVTVPYNGDLTINIIPNEMYHTAGVWVDGERVMNEDPYNASFMMYTLENITETHTINVEFKMEFHINKYAYNYSDLYAEVGGHFVPAEADTLLDPSGHVVTMIADEHYTLYSLVVGIIPPASEGAIIDGDNVIADVNYDPATRTYTYTFDTLYVSNYYVQACFKRDTVAINYATLTGVGVYDGVSVPAGETHDTWVDYGTDFTSSILPADGYYNMGVTVNGVDTGIIDHYDFDSVITTQYVTAQFGHKVTASIMNINNNEYLGSDEVRGTIAPAEQMILSGSSCSVAGTIQEHFHLSNFFVNGVDMLADVNWNGLNFSYTIDSLVANTDIVAVVRIDTIAIYYMVDGGNGYVNGEMMEAPAMDTLYIEYGSDFMSQFAAATGYHIVNVTVNGTAYDEIPAWLTESITEPQYITVTFALNEYDITTAAHGNGTVSDGVHVVYDPATTYVFVATPAVGSHISQIMRNNESLAIADPEATFTDTVNPILMDYSYVAYFAPNIYTVTASCGANGTIDPYGAQSYEYGATPTFTVTANPGYAIEHVYVDGDEVTLTNGAYTFAALTADHTISATFTEDTYTITATAGNGGSITPDGANVVMSGSTVVYTITPATGYEIADVTVDNVSVGAVATYTFENVAANHTIAATFSALQYTITATAGANGTITPAGVNTVAYGATPTFTVTANTGYEVDYVTVDGQNVTLTNGAYTFAAVTANHEIFAAFKVKSYTITVTDPQNGTITPNGVITVNYGATPTFTVTPNTGYEVTAITVNGSNVIANAQAAIMGAYTYTFPAVTANRTLTATMTKKHFTITATAGANGHINGPSTVEYGANATYTITPNDGYLVENVTVDGMSVGAVTTYTFHNVTANHTIHVTFKVEPCVVPSNLQTINIDSTSATLTWYHPGADSYDIQYKAATANTWTVVSNVPGFAYNLTNLQSSTTYVWKIKANTVGCTDADWSNATSFTTMAGPSTPDGINDYVKSHVNVYAEHNRVHIINDYNVDIDNVSIYDMYGKLIYSGNAINNPEVIELNVAVGTYVVRLNTQQGPAVYKVHINR